MKANTNPAHILVIDIGKTHIKLHVLDQDCRALEARSTRNPVRDEAPYPHSDIDAIWAWICGTIASLPRKHYIAALSVTTHGATAALIDRYKCGNGLVLPILDYEFAGVESCNPRYARYRPDYQRTFSPDLPLGLNLGRQLFWLRENFPREFAQTTNILLYPQYWGWRFSSALTTELTSLGCHTDLWEPPAQSWSSLVRELGWEKLFPPIVPAWQCIAQVREELAIEIGLDPECRVFAGVHDSNASYLRYLTRAQVSTFAVVSTGTWVVAMSSDTPLDVLDRERDMLANVDINGAPVACSRFMGGREFELICERLGASTAEPGNAEMLQAVIDAGVMALPNFSEGSGPFPHASPEFVGLTSEFSGHAIATLYCALMIDYQLDLLQAEDDIFIEGSFLNNPLLCGVLAQLREPQAVFLSSDTTGTVLGCAMLTHWKEQNFTLEYQRCPNPALNHLLEYRSRWRSCLASRATAR